MVEWGDPVLHVWGFLCVFFFYVYINASIVWKASAKQASVLCQKLTRSLSKEKQKFMSNMSWNIIHFDQSRWELGCVTEGEFHDK